MDMKRIGAWVSVLGLTALFAFSTFRCGSGADAELRVLRARAAKLQAKQAAAKAAVNDAYERSGGDWDLVRDAARRAEWLSGEEWAELNAIRERIEELEALRQSRVAETRPSDSAHSNAATPSGRNESSAR